MKIYIYEMQIFLYFILPVSFEITCYKILINNVIYFILLLIACFGIPNESPMLYYVSCVFCSVPWDAKLL